MNLIKDIDANPVSIKLLCETQMKQELETFCVIIPVCNNDILYDANKRFIELPVKSENTPDSEVNINLIKYDKLQPRLTKIASILNKKQSAVIGGQAREFQVMIYICALSEMPSDLLVVSEADYELPHLKFNLDIISDVISRGLYV